MVLRGRYGSASVFNNAAVVNDPVVFFERSFKASTQSGDKDGKQGFFESAAYVVGFKVRTCGKLVLVPAALPLPLVPSPPLPFLPRACVLLA